MTDFHWDSNWQTRAKVFDSLVKRVGDKKAWALVSISLMNEIWQKGNEVFTFKEDIGK